MLRWTNNGMKFFRHPKIQAARLFQVGLFFLCLCTQPVFGSKYFDFNSTCQQAYDNILSLNFPAGEKLLMQEESAHPDNLIPFFIENYIDVLKISIDENKDEYDQLYPNKEKRLDLMESGDSKSPYYLYTQSAINLQWAFVNLKLGQYYTAFWSIRKAYYDLEQNTTTFPDFAANQKDLGVIHALIGTIPNNYRWAASLLGFHGTIEQGVAELESAINYGAQHPFPFYNETRFYYIFILMDLQNRPQDAWNIVNETDFPDYQNNPVSAFVAASVADKNQMTDKAISILSSLKYPSTFTIPYLDFLYGGVKLNHLDDDANVYLEKYVAEFKGENNLKSAYQKLSWYYLLNNNMTKYNYYKNLSLITGATFTDPDKQAMVEAQRENTPNIDLLKARLLSDGGYFSDAAKILNGKSQNDFQLSYDKIEFNYRVGRIYQLSGDNDNCVNYYLNAITLGKDEPYYFAANAALELGYVYELKGDKKNALKYYKLSTNLPNTEYKNSIDQKAKAAISRLGG
jgi:hypothetical protein